MKLFTLILTLTLLPDMPYWGFFAHREINRNAVFTVPPPLFGFYKANIEYITEQAVTPDKRRYILKEEAAKHYIDLDSYPEWPPENWKAALEKYPEDSLQKHGILPWHLILLKHQLTKAFKEKNIEQILKLSADAGHYIADAHVPLHTTRNYNGQLTGQEGIHGFWESRLPELFYENYDLLTGSAYYLKNPSATIWETVKASHAAVDSVLLFEKSLSDRYGQEKKYTFEEKGNLIVKQYSKDYSDKYHTMLAGQVERQLKNSIITIGSFWYTCWVDAGKPELPYVKVETEHEEHPEVIQGEPCGAAH